MVAKWGPVFKRRVIWPQFFCSFLLQCIVVPSCSIPTHLFLHCMLIFCSFGILSSQSQISVSLTSGFAWQNICSASSHPPARAWLHCLTAKVIIPVLSAHFFGSAHLFLHCTCIVVQKGSSLRPCSEALLSANSADRQVDCLGEVFLRHYSEDAQFALCASQMSSDAWSTWAYQGAQSVSNLRFIAQTSFASILQCTKTSGLAWGRSSQALLSECTIWPRISCSSGCSCQMLSTDQSTCADQSAHRDGCRFCISQGGPLLSKEDVCVCTKSCHFS